MKAKYEFDALGQLLVERNVTANKVWKYTYDNRGNITKRQTYTYTATGFGTLTKTDNYEYMPSGAFWKDVLFRYNSGYNAYDSLGNPTEYDNGKYFTNMTWDQSRRLTSLDYGSDTYTYSYNSSGLRTQKVVGNTTYDYYWDGSTLSAMTITVGNTVKTLKFVYDDKGVPFALNYNGSMYLYQTNLQGDVTGLYNANGLCAYYECDAWGNILTYSGASITELTVLHDNPLRYRGYIFDEETGFYYLQTRFYDPVIGRFINADGQLNDGLLGNNQFIYCINNPANYIDYSGTYPIRIIKRHPDYSLVLETYVVLIWIANKCVSNTFFLQKSYSV